MKRFYWTVNLILCAVLLFSLTASAQEGPVVVSLGDSYSSGEGIEPFYGQDAPLDEKVYDQDWLGHRSQKSWPGQLRVPGLSGTLSDHRGVYLKNADGSYTLAQDGNWFFVAATGARTQHLQSTRLIEVSRSSKNGTVHGTFSLDPQLEIFEALAADGRHADYVTLTLGGNDIGFAQFMSAVVMNGSLAKSFHLNEDQASVQEMIDALWAHFDDAGGPHERILAAYRSITEAAGEQAAVLVAGYPDILDPDGAFLAQREDVLLLNESTERFNLALEEIVQTLQQEGINIHFVPVTDAFSGKGAYAPEEYINGLILGSGEQDFVSTSLFSSASFHPNEAGARAYARCVQQKIDELEAAKKKINRPEGRERQ